MKSGTVIVLGALGAMFLLGSSQKAKAATAGPLGPPSPTPPTPVAKRPKIAVTIGPATITSTGTPIPTGWIAAFPTPELQTTARSIDALGDPIGTRYPFTVGDKKYLALVVSSTSSPSGKAVAVLEPEGQSV
jgi:hypothetical protein